MAINDMFYIFYFHKLYKGWRRGKALPTVSYQTYTQDPNLCAVKTLDQYISHTKCWRAGEECSPFLLSFGNPYKSVVSSTISGWLKNVLRKVGSDIGTFMAHSTRAASTFKADFSGAPIEEILKRGCWFHKTIWQKFYKKEGQLFQEMVFK